MLRVKRAHLDRPEDLRGVNIGFKELGTISFSYLLLPKRCNSMINRLMKSRYSLSDPIIAFLPEIAAVSATTYYNSRLFVGFPAAVFVASGPPQHSATLPAF